MSWAGLTPTQWVSWDNANNAVSTSVFSARGGASTGARWITKSSALAYYWINPYTTSLYNKTNSQWVAKQDLVAGDVLSSTATIYYSSQTGHVVYGWANPCSIGTTLSATVYYNGSIAVNTKLYANTSYGILFTDAPSTTDWFSIGGTPVRLNTYSSGYEVYRYVTAIGTCISGTINTSGAKNINISLSSASPCTDTTYLTGTYVAGSDGLTYNWHMTFNFTSGGTSFTQTPISDKTGVGLVTGDAISTLTGGTPVSITICSTTTFTLTSTTL